MSNLSFAARVYRRLPLRRKALLALRSLGAPRAAHRLYFDGPFPVRLDETHEFLICQHNRWGIETSIFWNGLQAGWEPQSVAAWVKLCQSAQVILDVGAAEGLYALIAKCLRPAATVMAFEPFPPRLQELQRNVRQNHYDIACLHTALSNYEGHADFFFADDFAHTGGLARAPGGEAWRSGDKVPVTTLARVIEDARLDRLDLIKLDVEGAEPEVIEGLGPHLRAFRPAMLVEVLDDSAGARIEAQVDGLGYVYLEVDESGRGGGPALKRRHHIAKAADLNFLLLSEEQAAAVGA
jgi:FkbM family methyltransferase